MEGEGTRTCHHGVMPTELVPVVVLLAAIAIALGLLSNALLARRVRKELDKNPLQVVPVPTTQRPSLEDRLAELDDLHRRGIIDEEERRTARLRLLSEG